ncbi:hypothetical protein Peur_048615 [Populus x canadensis]
MEETKKSKVVDRTNLEHNLLNNLQWQEVGKRKKNNHKTMPSSFGTTDGTQLVNAEEIQAVDCITDCPTSELMNLKRSICQSMPQESVLPKVCMNTRVLPYEDCMAVEFHRKGNCSSVSY